MFYLSRPEQAGMRVLPKPRGTSRRGASSTSQMNKQGEGELWVKVRARIAYYKQNRRELVTLRG
ncbi:MAG: hypothetical protein ACPGWR_06830 [Ardenticatenaceae bacterium]